MNEDAIFKDLPYYKAIWKACLKKQITSLLEELATETGEESVIVLANASTGSASCFGSTNAKGFVEASSDFKMQFLSYCLKNCHTGVLPVTSGTKSTKRKLKPDLKSRKAKQTKFVQSITASAQKVPGETGELHTHERGEQIGVNQEQLDVPKQQKAEHFTADLHCTETSAAVDTCKEPVQDYDDAEKTKEMDAASDLSFQGPKPSDLPQTDMDSSQSDSMICIKTEQPDYEDYSVSQDADTSSSNMFGGDKSSSPMLGTPRSMPATGSPTDIWNLSSGSVQNTSTPQPIGPIRFLRKFPPKERTHLSLPEKIQIINDYETGVCKSQRELADRYNISKTAVGEMLRNKEVLKSYYEINANTKRKRFCTSSKFGDINEVVWQWFKTARENGVQMSGPMIQEKALQVAQELHVQDFKGSNGWLHSWKNRYNVTSFKDGSVGMSKENCIIDYSKIEGYTPTDDQRERTSAIMNLGYSPLTGVTTTLGNVSMSAKTTDTIVAGNENLTCQTEGKNSDFNFQDAINALLMSENVEAKGSNTQETSLTSDGETSANHRSENTSTVVKVEPSVSMG